jgi:excisionase family DNA binding protein
MERTMLNVREVAKRLQVDTSTVHRWVQQGHFPGAYKAGPGHTSPYRIPEEDITAFETKIGATNAKEQRQQ